MDIAHAWRPSLPMKRASGEASIFIKAAYGALAETADRPVAPFAALEPGMLPRSFARHLRRGYDGLSIYHASVMGDYLKADSYEEIEDELVRTTEYLLGPVYALEQLAGAPYSLRELLAELWPSPHTRPIFSAHQTLELARRWDAASSQPTA
jgi:hypothetical protein